MLNKDFFKTDTLSLAKNILGKVLVRNIGDKILKAKIVESEAYLGIKDRACHTYNNKKTDRNKILYMDCGTIYVYQTYGMHFLLNISSVDKGIPEGVLIRAVEPISAIDEFALNRFDKVFDELTAYQKKNITNGPAKLTKALKIGKSLNGENIFSKKLYLEEGFSDFEIEKDIRVGIDYAKEAREYPYRFFIRGNKYVSRFKQD